MRKLLAVYLGILAAVVGLIFLLGNAQPALAQPVRAVAAAVPADGIDLTWLQPFADQVQQLLQPMAAGLPIVLLIWLVVNALFWVGLIKDDANAGNKKRCWALGTGIVLGLYASLSALALTVLPIATLPLLVAILDGIIRGVAAGIVAALLYEGGSALLSKAKTP